MKQLFVMLPLVGCAIDGELDVGDSAQEIVSSNRLSMNRLSMNRLSMNRLSMNRLSMNRLSMNNLSTTAVALGGLADTVEGRELLSYVVRCALPANLALTVVDAKGVVLYTFPGGIGLAPEWESSPLSLSGQRWISACLLSHVNAFGVSVPISLRGPHPALATSGTELYDFPVQEGAFYGNLFADVTGDGVPDLQMYACNGAMLPTYAGNENLKLRVCADVTDTCQFTVVGDCDRRHLAPTWACAVTAKTQYQQCYSAGASLVDGKIVWPAGAGRYDEVITVYLQSSATYGTTSGTTSTSGTK